MFGRAYRLAQILSLDIVIGVVILLRFFCAQLGLSPEWEVYVLLGATVWLIYTVDHLRDAEISKHSTRARYVYHRENRKQLIVVCIVILICILPLLFFIPKVVFLGGLALAIFSLIYLLVQHKLSALLSKELYVAMIYSLGILMIPNLLSKALDLVSFILLFLLTFTNLILFSWFERKEDENDGFESIATRVDEKKLEKVILILICIGLSLAILNFNMIHAYFLTGFSLYVLMYLFPKNFRKDHRYRTIGDGVFMMPILFEWL